MDTTIAETIPVADLIALVRKHAELNSWCEQAERYLDRLGVKFAYDIDICWCSACKPDDIVRFTLAADSPTTVSKDAAMVAADDAHVEYGITDLLADAAKLFDLKIEVAR